MLIRLHAKPQVIAVTFRHQLLRSSHSHNLLPPNRHIVAPETRMTTTSENRETKKARLEDVKVIGTHNGSFHCDEALACFLLRQTEMYNNATVVRSRDESILEKCDIVVDVGGIYDHDSRRYDHHQRGFSDVFGHGFETKLSSAGLVYRHYGKEIIANRLQLAKEDDKIEMLWLKIYKEFIEAIDGIDNGVEQYPRTEPRYRNRTDLSSRVGWLNPTWNETSEAAKVDALFEKASAMTGSEFISRLDYYANSWIPAREIVDSAFQARFSVHTSGYIFILTRFAPWKEHLFEIEAEHDVRREERPLYVIYPDETASNWRIQAIPISADSFESRKALPEAWRGVRDDRLSQLTGIPGCVFVHASGFIGGNATQEGALNMAKLALEL